MAILALLVALQGPAQASTYYYYRGGAQATQAAGAKPASPTPQGTFAILIDAPEIGVRGTGYSATTYAYSNVGAVVFSVRSGVLPAGISINATTGTISGTPSATGTSSLVIQGVDSSTGSVATVSLAIEVDDPFSITGTPSALVLKNTPYSADFTLAGGSQPYGFSIGALPPGVAFTSSSSTANIGGVPTQTGSYNIIVTGSEVHGLIAQYPYTLQVYDTLAVSGAPPAAATVGTPYSGQVTVTGGAAPYTYTLAAGTLPTGITLKAATGVISGTPTTAGIKSNIKIKVADATGQSATSAAFSIAVAATGTQPLTISVTPVTTGRENQSYTTQYTAGGGSGSYSFSMVGGALPSGVALNANSGLISGAPLGGTAGTYPNISAKVVDTATHESVAAPYTLTIASAQIALSVTGSPSTSVQVGSPYAAQFAGNGGTGAGYVFALGAGTLPAGLSLSPTGMLSGTPSAVGTHSGLRIRVTDNASNTALSNQFTINVVSPPSLTISGAPVATVNAGNSYSATWTAFDGSGAGYHFVSVGSALPPGLSLSDINGAQGLLSGIATTAGTYSGLRIQVSDSLGNTATTPAFSIAVTPPPPPPPPQTPLSLFGTPVDAVYGQAYSVTFAGGGGSPSYVYSITGTLPAGLTLDPVSGALAGTPTQIGNFPGLQVTVTDSVSDTASSAVFAINVADPNPLSISWTPQTNWQVGDFVAVSPDTLGGDNSNYSYSSVGTLPSGLSLFSNGTLFGTLDTAGTFGPFQIQVTDGVRTATTQAVTFSVAVPGLFVSGFPAANADENQAYSAQFSAQGGSGSGYTFSMNGALPNGLTLDPSSGLISGTPAIGSAATYANLSVHVVDGVGDNSNSAVFTITVHPLPALTVVGTPPTTSTLGGNYSTIFSATGGTSTGYVYSLGSGTLPTGLTIAANGTLAGSPTAVGTFGPLQIRVTDSAAITALSAPFSIDVVDDAPLSVSWAPQTTWIKGSALSVSASPSGGVPSSYVFGITGTLPGGVTQSPADGSLSGTVGTVGTYGPIAITVSDGLRSAATNAVSFAVVYPALNIAGTPSGTGLLGVDYSAQYTASGGSGAGYTFAVSSGSLAPGLSLSAAGLISGKPTSTGSFGPATISLTDGVGASTTTTLSITVTDGAPLSVSWSPTTSIVLGSGISATPTPTGGLPGSYVWGVSGTLPSGVTQNSSTGALTGSPSSVGSYGPIAITVSDGYRSASTAPATFTVSYPGMAVAGSPPAANLGVAYSSQLTATGGTNLGYVFTIDSGALPPGLTLSASGLISGIPTVTGSSGPTTVRVTDSASNSAVSGAFTIAVTDASPLSVSWTPTTAITLGNAISGTVTTTGGLPSGFVYGHTGTLPSGVSQDPSTGSLTGTPSAVGTFGPITITLDDGYRTASTAPATFTIDYPGMTVAGSPAGNATVGAVYGAQFTGSGGTGSGFVYSVTAGTLPAGLVLDPSSGALAGTPTTAGNATGIVVTATDDGGHSASSSVFSILVSDPLTLAATLPVPTVGQSYSGSFVRGGGQAAYAYAVISGTLPTGLTLNPSSGALAGTPAAAGTSSFTVQVTDGAGRTATASGTVTVSSAMTLAGSPPSGIINTAYSYAYAASGGRAPYGYALSGTLPTGLTFSNGGITGTAAAAGTFPGISVTATDADGRTATAGPSSIVIASLTAPTGSYASSATAGTAYSSSMLVGSNGVAPYTWALASGALPSGLTLATNGTIAGTPTVTGTFGFTVRVTDANGVVSPTSAGQSITVAAGTASAALGVYGVVHGGRPISGSLSTSITGATWSFATTPSISVSGSGSAWSGTTPSVASDTTLTITGTASGGGYSVQASPMTMTIRPPLTIATPATISGTAGTALSVAAPSVGYQVGSLSYALTSGNLAACPGLSFSSGTITGTPSAACSQGGFTITATDAADSTSVTTGAFSISIAAPPSYPPSTGGTATPGSCNLPIPNYNTLRIRVWGAGGGGTTWGAANTTYPGTTGGYSTILGLVAYGGNPSNGATPGTGGGASGGDVNIPGNTGATGTGVYYPSPIVFPSYAYGATAPAGGGAGGGGSTSAGAAPGGGGAGGILSGRITLAEFYFAIGGGAGSGGYTEKTYTRATGPAPGSVVPCTVGSGGTYSVNGPQPGGTGGAGGIYVDVLN